MRRGMVGWGCGSVRAECPAGARPRLRTRLSHFFRWSGGKEIREPIMTVLTWACRSKSCRQIRQAEDERAERAGELRAERDDRDEMCKVSKTTRRTEEF